jgi:hypothetical protein
MTVTISSTTDTVDEVKDVATQANPVEEPPTSTPESEVETAPVEAVSETDATDNDQSVAASSEDEPAEEPAEESAEEPAEDAPAIAVASDEVPKPKRRRRGRSYKERASQLAREKAQETARAQALELELERLRAEPPPAPPVAEPPEEAALPEEHAAEGSEEAPRADGRPNQDSFETYEDFQEALVDWKVTQRLEADQRDRVERDAREKTQRATRDLVAAHTARIDEFRTKHEDFDAVVEAGQHLPITQPMQDSVLNSDLGPEMMYHLCRNPEECDRIASMHPIVAIKEMGRLEARLEVARTGPTPTAKSVTRAPRPIKPVGGGVTASSVPLDQMSYQDYKRAREQQIEGRQRS